MIVLIPLPMGVSGSGMHSTREGSTTLHITYHTHLHEHEYEYMRYDTLHHTLHNYMNMVWYTIVHHTHLHEYEYMRYDTHHYTTHHYYCTWYDTLHNTLHMLYMSMSTPLL